MIKEKVKTVLDRNIAVLEQKGRVIVATALIDLSHLHGFLSWKCINEVWTYILLAMYRRGNLSQSGLLYDELGGPFCRHHI